MICGRCKRDLENLTSNGLCVQCSVENDKEIRERKQKFIKQIFDNNFNVTLISELTGKPKTYISEFIKNNNLKRLNENKYTCTKCGNIVDQVYTDELSGLCSDCINKLKKVKAKEINQKLRINEMATAISTPGKLKLVDDKVKDPSIEHIEHTKKLKNGKPEKDKIINPVTKKFKKPSIK